MTEPNPKAAIAGQRWRVDYQYANLLLESPEDEG